MYKRMILLIFILSICAGIGIGYLISLESSVWFACLIGLGSFGALFLLGVAGLNRREK